jgi:5-methylcytosine-specific restriction protein A
MAERKAWARSGPDRRVRGSAGQKMRARRLARTDGLCEMCNAEGLTTLATVVNHKVPLAHGGEEIDANTENLCDRHDAIVTAKQFDRAEPRAVVGTDTDGWPIT